MRIEVELFGGQGNFAIVRLPERQYPGVLFQGDSLFNLAMLATSVRERAQQTADADLVDEATELHELLWEALLHYEAELESRALRLPYLRPKQNGEPPVKP